MRYILTLYNQNEPVASGEYPTRDKAEKKAKRMIKENPDLYYGYMIEEVDSTTTGTSPVDCD